MIQINKIENGWTVRRWPEENANGVVHTYGGEIGREKINAFTCRGVDDMTDAIQILLDHVRTLLIQEGEHYGIGNLHGENWHGPAAQGVPGRNARIEGANRFE